MGKKQYGMSGQREIENNYKKGKYQRGNMVYLKDGTLYKIYKIVQVIDKGLYNMYLCERNEKSYTHRTNITDKEDVIVCG